MKRQAGMAIVSVLVAASTALAAGKKAASDNAAPASVRTYAEAVMMLTSNAQGEVTSATVTPYGSSTAYVVVTNDIPAATVKEWLKMHDRAVTLKGEIVQFGDKMGIKVSGPVKDLTASILRGGRLQVFYKADTKQFDYLYYWYPDGRSLAYLVPK